ncbi:MAG: hypothetical protein AAF458_01970 [Pseudomonadota bacterium]
MSPRTHRLPQIPIASSFGGELLLSIVIVITLMTLFVPYASMYINKARLTQIFSISTHLRTELVTDRAILGEWPDRPAGQLPELTSDLRLERVVMTEGNFNLILSGVDARKEEHNLSFRLAANPELGTLIWYCGYARPDVTARVEIPAITTVPAEYLPPVCRSAQL